MLHITVDDSQIQAFIKKSPRRANWALKEAFGKAGGHYRKWLHAYIKKGGEGWQPLSDASGGLQRKPLQALGAMTRFRVSKLKKTFYRLQVGFFGAKTRGQTVKQYRAYRERFKTTFGMTPQALAKIHEYGKTRRVTPAMRRKMHYVTGKGLKASTKKMTIPARPMVQTLYKKKHNEMVKYIEKNFFDLFFSKRNAKLRI